MAVPAADRREPFDPIFILLFSWTLITVSSHMALPGKPSLRRRTAIVVTLTIGFYLMVIVAGCAIAAVTYWLCKANWDRESTVLVGIVLEFALFYAALPPIFSRRQYGVPLNPEIHPELFDLIAKVAKLTGQQMPAKVVRD
jgi:type IV secretory pathway VirB2 component (pilin)